ncbi:MAG: hypothetical protein ACREND_08430, partial [Gemmatimonadaceae bacterium]
CGIVQPLSDTDPRWLGPRELQPITDAHRHCHPIVSMYADWLDHRVHRWDELNNWAINGQEAERRCAFASAEGQWGYMALVAEALIENRVVAESSLRQSNGSSRGRPWTQLRFFEGKENLDVLFYRIDAGRDVEFTLKQYQPSPKPRKLERLTELRELFSESAGACNASFGGLQAPRRGAAVDKEARIATISLTKIAPSTLLDELPKVHAGFVRRLRERNWPVPVAD